MYCYLESSISFVCKAVSKVYCYCGRFATVANNSPIIQHLKPKFVANGTLILHVCSWVLLLVLHSGGKKEENPRWWEIKKHYLFCTLYWRPDPRGEGGRGESMPTDEEPTFTVKLLQLILISTYWGMQIWVTFVSGRYKHAHKYRIREW